MLIQLYWTFVKAGLASFGGGYSVLPMIQSDVTSHGWVSLSSFKEIVSLAGTAPGPIATNAATLIGYRVEGVAGAATATIGMITPSLLIVVLLSAFLVKVRDRQSVKAIFYGLRPIVTALIVFSAIHFGMPGTLEALGDWRTIATLVIAAGCVAGVMKYRVHPLAVIAASAVAGIVLF